MSKPLKPPQPPDATAGGLSDDWLTAGESYANLRVAQADWSGQSADHVGLERARLTRVALRNTALPAMRLKDVQLEECDCANADWYRLVCHRVEFAGCRLLGLRAGEAHLENTGLRDCAARLANFRFAVCKAVRFERCDLSEADFQGADLSGVVFLDCDLRNAELSGAKLGGADLRGSQLDGIHLGVDELRGATVDPLQAIGLIRLLGVLVDVRPAG